MSGDLAPITAEEAKRRLDGGEPVTFLDARNEDAWRKSAWQIPRARRMPADDVAGCLDELPLDGALIVPYGDSSEEGARVALALRDFGWTNVRPLLGGPDEWRQAGYPAEPKPARKLTAQEASANLQMAEGD